MATTLPTDALDLLEAFARHHVDALVVGGWAVAIHGRPRATKDVDIWIRSSRDTLDRARNALVEFGAPAPVVEALLTASDTDVVWMGRPPNRVDLLKGVPGGDFERAWATRQSIVIADVLVSVVGLDELITIKEASGRPVDLEDVRLLRRAARRGPEDTTP